MNASIGCAPNRPSFVTINRHPIDKEQQMRGIVFTGDRNLELMEFEDPTPGPREVVLEIKASGMCGSDLHRYRAAPGGGSAGGHLAAACGNIIGLEEDREDLTISSKPNALVLFNPVYDNSKDGFGYRRMNGRHLEISPLHNITKGAPPTIVFFGTKDKTTPVSSSKAYEKKMHDVGSRCDLFLYEGQEHSFFNRGKYFIETLRETDIFLESLGYLSGKPTI